MWRPVLQLAGSSRLVGQCCVRTAGSPYRERSGRRAERGRGPGLAGLWPIKEGRDPVERRLVWDRDARISSRAPGKPPRTGQRTGRAMPADADVRMTRWPAGGPVLCSVLLCLLACQWSASPVSGAVRSLLRQMSRWVFLMPMLRVTRRMTSHSARTCIACLGSATQQDGCAMAEASDNLESGMRRCRDNFKTIKSGCWRRFIPRSPEPCRPKCCRWCLVRG